VIISVRRAEPHDVEALLPLVHAYRAFYEQQSEPNRERSFLEGHLLAGTSVIYLALALDRPAGFLQLFKSHSTVLLGPSWILEDLFVAPEFRRHGIARALLERSIEHAKEENAVGMFLETAYGNETAQRVYERAGWTREDRFCKYNAPLT